MEKKTQPSGIVMLALSLLGGVPFALVFLWIFGIEVSTLERLKEFPDGWSIRELIANATTLVMICGATFAVHKGLKEYYNPSQDEQGPPQGGV